MNRSPIGLYVQHNANFAEVLGFVMQLGGVRVMLFRVRASQLHRLRLFREWVDLIIWLPIVDGIPPEELYLHGKAVDWLEAREREMAAAGFAPGDLMLHLHNEVGVNAGAIQWEINALNAGLSRGHKFGIIGSSVGTPDLASGQFVPYRPLIEIAAQNPDQVSVILHEYFSIFAKRKLGLYLGRWKDWLTFQEKSDIPGRLNIIIGEYGAEDISDDHLWTRSLPREGDTIGPVHTLHKAWAAVYDTIDNPDRQPYPGLVAAYVQQLWSGWESVYKGLPLDEDEEAVQGLILFTAWGDSQWKDYEVWNLGGEFRDKFRDRWLELRGEQVNPDRVYFPDKLGDPRHATVSNLANPHLNIRFGPGLAWNVRSTAKPGIRLSVYPDTVREVSAYKWYYTDRGWVANPKDGPGFIHFDPPANGSTPAPVPPPATAPEIDEAALRRIIKDELLKVIPVIVGMVRAEHDIRAQAMQKITGAHDDAEVQILSLLNGKEKS